MDAGLTLRREARDAPRPVIVLLSLNLLLLFFFVFLVGSSRVDLTRAVATLDGVEAQFGGPAAKRPGGGETQDVEVEDAARALAGRFHLAFNPDMPFAVKGMPAPRGEVAIDTNPELVFRAGRPGITRDGERMLSSVAAALRETVPDALSYRLEVTVPVGAIGVDGRPARDLAMMRAVDLSRHLRALGVGETALLTGIAAPGERAMTWTVRLSRPGAETGR